MKNTFKTILIRFLVGLFRLATLLKNGLKYFFLWGLGKPLIFIGKILFLPLMTWFYKLFLPLRQKVKIIFLPSKNNLLYIFTSRYLIHVIVIIASLLVATNSIWARDINIEQFGKKTIISQLITGPEQADVTEYAATETTANSNYLSQTGFVRSQLTPSGEIATAAVDATETNNIGLIKANVLTATSTDQAGNEIIQYEIKGGDTVSSIAAEFGISTKTILFANNLTDSTYIKPGDKLMIPPVSGVVYKVKSGDTIDKIAKQYEVDVDEILESNKLSTPEALQEGETIIIPGGKFPEPPKPVTPKTSNGYAYTGPIPSSAKAAPGPKLFWPTPSHKINQYFGWRHTGLDIDGTYASPIYAADDGKVVAVGWGSGYGNRIIINHGNKETLYGHLSKFFVSAGQQVVRGQTIGMMGCTGWCTGPHVHFEVRIGGRVVNPLSYL